MRSNGVIAVFFYNLQENWDFNKHNVILKGLPVLSVSAHENFSPKLSGMPTTLP